MQLCFSFVAKLSTKMQNETQFLMNTIVKINIKKFQQFFKIDFSRPLMVRAVQAAVEKTTTIDCLHLNETGDRFPIIVGF